MSAKDTDFEIISTSKRKHIDGSTSGGIQVKVDGRKYNVKFSKDSKGHSEQWGAPMEVLIKTYKTFERLMEP
jgi:hypothetical protein